jgi:hypothetical protein
LRDKLSKALIVGIDPGITSGIAVLDLKGNLLGITSKRYVKKGFLVEYSTKFGTPIIIATDVNPPPKTVKKLAKTLGCKLYYPEVSLSNLEKVKLVKKYDEETGGYHQKDALAAGIKALKNYRELFSKIQDAVSKFDKKIFDEVAIKIIRDGADNIRDAIKKIMRK